MPIVGFSRRGAEDYYGNHDYTWIWFIIIPFILIGAYQVLFVEPKEKRKKENEERKDILARIETAFIEGYEDHNDSLHYIYFHYFHNDQKFNCRYLTLKKITFPGYPLKVIHGSNGEKTIVKHVKLDDLERKLKEVEILEYPYLAVIIEQFCKDFKPNSYSSSRLVNASVVRQEKYNVDELNQYTLHYEYQGKRFLCRFQTEWSGLKTQWDLDDKPHVVGVENIKVYHLDYQEKAFVFHPNIKEEKEKRYCNPLVRSFLIDSSISEYFEGRVGGWSDCRDDGFYHSILVWVNFQGEDKLYEQEVKPYMYSNDSPAYIDLNVRYNPKSESVIVSDPRIELPHGECFAVYKKDY